MKNIQLLQKVLIRHEGKVNKVYKDRLGYKTAGIGHLLVNAEKNLAVGAPIPEAQIQQWFDEDIEIAIAIAIKFVPDLRNLDEVRQVVLVSLAFNLGNKLGQFKYTLAFVNTNDWDRAASNLKFSLWYQQVKSRGPELCDALRTGKFSF